MELRRVSLDDPVAQPLLDGLLQEYLERYGPGDEMQTTKPDQFEPPAGLFVVALDGSLTVGGGGFRRHAEGVCEVKRMWTHPDYRRRGLARRVLAVLEKEAAAAGYRRLVLETGPAQPEAAALYSGLGYTNIPIYGPYPQGFAFERLLTGT